MLLVSAYVNLHIYTGKSMHKQVPSVDLCMRFVAVAKLHYTWNDSNRQIQLVGI